MSFTTKLKEEISKGSIERISALPELSAFIKYNNGISLNKIILTIENASVARRIYKLIKCLYDINIKVIIRNQKRFRVKQIYILEISENTNKIFADLQIYSTNKDFLNTYLLDTTEDKIAFLKGAFLACGSISDPSTSGYHMEYVIRLKKEALEIQNLLSYFSISSKILKRANRYMTYIKNAENISDIIKMFGATNSLFYFEDIRIYRDHKNMVNRLNNCEVANQDKAIKASLDQMENIIYLKNHDLINLLDNRTKDIILYREKYPNITLNELAKIISLETNKPITKSGVNHCFIKVRQLVNRHKNNQK